MERRDYTAEAEALFRRFVDRHSLAYEVEADPPIEALWTVPAQPKLSLPITLGLQNADELNFGVADFWSYFFPFEAVSERFEHILDAWVTGDARIAVTALSGRHLQVRESEQWSTAYRANGCLLPFTSRHQRFICNEPGSD